MSTLPFTITAEALAYIEQRLIVLQRATQFLARERIIDVEFNTRWLDGTGKGGNYAYLRLTVGHLASEDQGDSFAELDLAGFRVLVRKDRLDFLAGKRVMLTEAGHRPVLAVEDDDRSKPAT